MINEDKLDCKYYHTLANKWTANYKDICELQYKEFLAIHGVNGIVCTSSEEAVMIKKKYGNLIPVIVPQTKYEFISNSESYKAIPKIEREQMTPEHWIRNWLTRLELVGLTDVEEYSELIEESKKWRYK